MEQYRQTEEIKSAEVKAYYIPARAKEDEERETVNLAGYQSLFRRFECRSRLTMPRREWIFTVSVLSKLLRNLCGGIWNEHIGFQVNYMES